MSAEATITGNAGQEAYGDELAPGTKLLRGQYTIDRYLNSGGFGITYLAKDSLDRIVVIKECFPSSMCYRASEEVRPRSYSHQQEFSTIVKFFGQEARALAKLDHPHIVGVHQVFEDNETAYMALDFVKGRDLLDIIEGEEEFFTSEQIRDILEKILSAVAYVHDRDILHRDISPDNILLDNDDSPVLIDFGAAREEATRASRVLSSLQTVKDGYSPQEFYVSGSHQTPSSDLYALAATFYHLINGSPPPVAQDRLAAVAAGKEDPYQPLAGRNKEFDRFFLGAIDSCLAVHPDDRLQSAQEWLEEIDTERRRKAALARAKKDRQMELAISELVAETNDGLEQGKPGDSKTAERPGTKTSQMRQLGDAKPVSAPIPKPVAHEARAPETIIPKASAAPASPPAAPPRRSLFRWLFNGSRKAAPESAVSPSDSR